MTEPVVIAARAVPEPRAAKAVGGSGSAEGPAPRPEPQPVDAFLKAIEPFFQDQPVTYVDVGAHRGDVLKAIVEKGPRLREALLIEPNPASFAGLEERVEALNLNEKARCFNVALSDAPGRLRLRDDDTMTKVIDPTDEAIAPGRVFEIEAVTLDALASELSKPRINLLKIDVEGFELPVIAGARGLLAEQAVDMIYIEAGLSPEATQQTYFRLIEDALGAHGYRVFRIFEQKHEWIEDSPFLRRVNLAFMSPRFAAAHPYELCSKLLAQRQANEALKRDRAAGAAELAALRAEHDALRARHDTTSARLAEARERSEDLGRELEAARVGAEAMREAMETLSRDHAVELGELRQRLGEVAAVMRLLEAERAERAAVTERLSAQVAEAEAKATEATAQLSRERAAAATSSASLDQVTRYARDLETRHAAMLDSETWRAMAPIRSIMRLLKGGKKPVPFVPWLSASQPGAGRAGRIADPRHPDEVAEIARYAHYLWAGLSRPAVRAMERVLADPGYNPESRFDAAHKLATWYAFDGDLDGALRVLRTIDEVMPARRAARERLIKEGFVHLRRGDKPAARAAFERLLRQKGETQNPDAILALANCLPDDETRLAQLNKVFARAGHVGIARIDSTRPLGLDNIRGLPATCAIPDLGRVSVIMPTFASVDSLRMAIRSVQEQTYRNLEIIVVDDCSPDRTHAIAAELAGSDDRIIAIRQEENGGAYAARNRGLKQATGAFITTHDADDWSHPQKIERELAFLSAKPDVMGVCTHWVRATSDLQITPNWRIGDRIIHWSHSSFLFRRQVLERLGSWDPTRIGADTEFIWRVQAAYGKDAFRMIERSVPLAFALDDEGSLTRTKQTHVRTIHFGLRQIYRAVAQHSHARPEGTGPAAGQRRFAALPAVLTGGATAPLELDLLMMGNCCDPAIVADMGDFMEDPTARGKRIGVFHWPDFKAPPALICAAYADLLLDRGVIPVPPQTEVALATGFGIFFGDCTIEPDALPVMVAPVSTRA